MTAVRIQIKMTEKPIAPQSGGKLDNIIINKLL